MIYLYVLSQGIINLRDSVECFTLHQTKTTQKFFAHKILTSVKILIFTHSQEN